MSDERERWQVGVNAWGWTPWGLPFAVGMALHSMDDSPRTFWSARDPAEQTRDERRYPENLFVQNAREADNMVSLHRLARAMLCHDRPERFARMSGAYERPDGGFVQPHALWEMEAA